MDGNKDYFTWLTVHDACPIYTAFFNGLFFYNILKVYKTVKRDFSPNKDYLFILLYQKWGNVLHFSIFLTYSLGNVSKILNLFIRGLRFHVTFYKDSDPTCIRILKTVFNSLKKHSFWEKTNWLTINFFSRIRIRTNHMDPNGCAPAISIRENRVCTLFTAF